MTIKNIKFLCPLFFSIMLFTGCGGGKHGETTPGASDPKLRDTHPYVANSRYRNVLQKCAGAKSRSESCKVNELPFLALEQEVPSKELIMQRVLVSHDWMGKRFEEMLDLLEDDMKVLLGAVTAIVIDDDIIPSYYWIRTGAMYIDPRYLWLTPSEARSITEKDDYRSGFGKELRFSNWHRDVKNNRRAYNYFAIDSNQTRTLNDIKYRFAGLLYHELMHANDFFPPYKRDKVIKHESVETNLRRLGQDGISVNLYARSPLKAQHLKDIAEVLYRGKAATVYQKGVYAEDMGSWFSNDYANAMYSYSTIFEDTAMLFQRAMIKYHYGVESDQVFIDNPIDGVDFNCANAIIGWGERNSVAKDEVRSRAAYVTKLVFPSKDWDTMFSQKLGTSKVIPHNKSWCETLNLNAKMTKGIDGDINTTYRDAIYKEDMIPPY
ncbi:MAG: hypothetical protein HF962_04045 [Sulfurovum sp.]|nr:hypothetical protein [Sulfurovum sp.]